MTTTEYNSKEEWRNVVGYEGRYEVSSFGNVRSTGANIFHKARILKCSVNCYGYACATLYHPRKPRNKIAVHLLVAAAFIEPKPDGFQVNHKDGIKTNNSRGNLEYVTPGDNTRHAVRMGLRDNIPRPGARHASAKLTEEAAKEIRTSREKGQALALRYQVSASLISAIRHGDRWKHLD